MNIVITGASRGIGRAIAEIFAEHGHDLYLTSRSDVKLHTAAEELKADFPDITIRSKPFDLSVKEQAQRFGNWCLGHMVPDILVNNAGTFEPGSVFNEPEGNLENQIAANLYSSYHVTRALVPKMIQRRTGHIFNM